MKQETFQLSGSAAAIYEEQKVLAIFSPLAEATLDAVPLFDDDIGSSDSDQILVMNEGNPSHSGKE